MAGGAQSQRAADAKMSEQHFALLIKNGLAVLEPVSYTHLDVYKRQVSYLRIVFAGLIFTFFYNFLAATMRALGDSKSALYFLMIGSVLNIGGDLFFVQVLNPTPRE